MPPLTRRTGHLIVCGDNALAYRVVKELTEEYGETVRVILPSRRRNYGPELAKLAKAVVESERLDEEAFIHARIRDARAVAFCDQDDVGNLHAALRAQALHNGIRLVIRIFNMDLGRPLRELFADCTMLSDASIAAPTFVAAALGEVAPNHARLPPHTLYVTTRETVPQDKVICGLAHPRGSDKERLLPEDHQNADLVLAIADGSLREPLRRGKFRRLPHVVVWSWLGGLFSRKLRIAAVVLSTVVVLGSLLYGTLANLPSWEDSVYVTLLTAAGGGEPDLTLPLLAKVVQTLVMLSGIALVPVVTAAVVDGLVGARLALTVGRLRDSLRSHVVVVGLGNVGSRVMVQLHDLGLPVVAIDHDAAAKGVRMAQERRIPVILGDATQEETLRAARVEACRALVAVTSDDVKNLEAALLARRLTKEPRIVLRLGDEDLARRIELNFGFAASRSVAQLAAVHFALAMVQRKVFGTIPVGGWQLLFADFPVAEGSALEANSVSKAHIPGKARVIAINRPGEPELWAPPEDWVLRAGDRLVVLATREGIAEMSELTSPVEDDTLS